jgi:hypothetical protein
LLQCREKATAVTFRPGQSGNPRGWPKGKKQKRPAHVRALITEKTGTLVEKILTNAENGDVESLRLFCRYLMPKHRFVPEPIDLPAVQNATEIQAQIARLASLAGEGSLDLDSMTAISRVLATALGARLEELEELLGEKEAQVADDDQR